ncbi:MAG TPA: PTS sugar transporter subunit IIA [Firmicutes bacterium]|nr:PTS sugar transporter subunit IIA [Bacillota bacterium]
MEIKKYINHDSICFFRDEKSKKVILESMIKMISASGLIPDEEEFKKAIFEREKILSTGIGFGIAIPHAKLSSISDFTIGIGISKQGIDYGSLDEKKVYIIVMIAGPTGRQKDYLSLLSRVLLVLKNVEVRDKILACKKEEQIFEIFTKY